MDVDTKERISLHAIIFEHAEDARRKAAEIEGNADLEFVGLTDATFGKPHQAEQRAAENHLDEFGKRMNAINGRIAERIEGERVVCFSAFPSDDDRLPIDNLDDVPIQGKVIFRAEADDFWGEGHDYESDVVDSPTWLEVAVLADEMIKTTGDYHHQFLERVRVIDEEDGVKVARFSMGS
ncbi:MAG: hypothetical protein RIC55_02130 [Pirellulaceae bacterium]